MNKPLQAVALEGIETWETNDPTVFGLMVKNEKQQAFLVAANVSGMTHVIGKLLDLAHNPVFAAATLAADVPGQQCHTDASRLELASGRSPTEVAVKLKLGCVEMVVFVPLPEVLRAIDQLMQSIEPDTSAGPH